MSNPLLHPSNPDAVPYSRPDTPNAHSLQQIGFIGLGAMGYHMAQNLANHRASLSNSHSPLLVWNRSAEKSEKLLRTLGVDKVRVAQDLAEVAKECDVIITNLANDTVVKSVYEQLVNALKHESHPKNRIFVETSTIYPSLAGELEVLLESAPHSRLITCPVFGQPAMAARAQLLIIMSGDYRSKKEIAYLLVPAVGRKVIDLGENLEKAPTFKLIGNSMIMGTLEILAEAYTLAEKTGIDVEKVHHLVQEILPAPGTVAYSDKMAHDKFDGSIGFALDGGIKDASHIRRLTAEVNSPMPAIDVAHQHLLTARALHEGMKKGGKAIYETLDWAGIIAGPRVGAGLDGLDSKKHESIVRED